MLENRERFERFLSGLSRKNRSNLARFLDKPLKTVEILRGFWAFFLDKPLKNRSYLAQFLSFFLDKPLQPLKSSFNLGEKSRLGQRCVEIGRFRMARNFQLWTQLKYFTGNAANLHHF